MHKQLAARSGQLNAERSVHTVNIKLATATLGAAIILAAAPAFASAADFQSGPIRIDSVQVSGGTTTDDNDSTVIVPGSAAIAFTNQYSSPATDVVFALETNGYVVDRFDDVGSFAPGVAIKHRFSENRPSDDMRVAVEQATFADGTVWHNPDVAPAPQDPTPVGVEATRF
jgi:hypothetical protein